MTELARLRWRCRRGMRELDMLLSGFLEQHYAGADFDLQKAFSSMLEELDQDILDWIMQRQSCPTCYASVIRELQQFSASRRPESN